MEKETPKGFKGLDIAGLGRIAEAIPPKVYEQTVDVVLTTFQELTAPITETTKGIGLYLKQKFANMVEFEREWGLFTLQEVMIRARAKMARQGLSRLAPAHAKSFVKAIEEASKESDPILHEMWTNLLASQLTDDKCHPHFVEVLPHFSPAEAQILISLLPHSAVGENDGGYIYFDYDSFTHWVRKTGAEVNVWTPSCALLCEFGFSALLGPKGSPPKVTILYRTQLGSAFLAAVSLNEP